ncbi:MAG: GntP family permease [Ignavibacteriae bacterium]|nr:GntP family permease [Ignavibacteriota bacterium]
MPVLFLIVAVVLIVLLTARFNLHPFLSLLVVSILYGLVAGMSLETIIGSINDGFGSTTGKIGLIIVLGIIIGTFLENSGAAYTLADKILGLIGRKRVIPAMGIIGYFISIPVFADSGFLLVSPLNKSLSKKAGISLAGSAVALGLGLTATHTMVPPTPGPVAAAGILGADLGMVMLVGLPVSALALVAGVLFASVYAARTYIDPNPGETDTDLEARTKDAPHAVKSSLPVVVPILLIVFKSVTANSTALHGTTVHALLSFLGEPVIALLIGAFLAMLLPKKLTSAMLSTEGWVGKSMKDAASILLITGAGGIFGKILQNSGIADTLGDTLVDLRIGIVLPFVIAAAIKTAQGSSTVAMITAASIIAPMMDALGFVSETEKALAVITLGAGSAVVSHANDSFFWVVTQMTGMNVKTDYRLYTLGTLVLGTATMVVLLLSSLII